MVLVDYIQATINFHIPGSMVAPAESLGDYDKPYCCKVLYDRSSALELRRRIILGTLL